MFCGPACRKRDWARRRAQPITFTVVDPDELSESQRLYVDLFERKLRTNEGIDICLGIAERIGVWLTRRDRSTDL